MKYDFQKIMSLFVLICLSSCSELESVKALNVPKDLLGEWKTECVLNDENNPDGGSHIIEDTISKDKIISEFDFFTDGNCIDKKGEKTLTIVAVFNGKKSSTELGDAYQIDGTFVSRVINGKNYNKGLGTTIYSIVYVKDSIMYYAFFDGTEGFSPEKRITKLDQRIKYVKQQ